MTHYVAEEQAAGRSYADDDRAAVARARIWARLRPYEQAFVRHYDYQFTPGEEYGEPPLPDEWFVPDPDAYARRLEEEREEEAYEAYCRAHPLPGPPGPEPAPPYIPRVVPRPASTRAWKKAGYTIMDRTRLRRPLAPHFGERDTIADDEGTLWIPAADAARIMGVTLSAVRQWHRRHNRRTPWLPLPVLEGGHAGTFFRLYDVLQRALVLEGGI